jgi:hypothetical protein
VKKTFNLPKAIGFGRFLPENGQKKKSKQSCLPRRSFSAKAG